MRDILKAFRLFIVEPMCVLLQCKYNKRMWKIYINKYIYTYIYSYINKLYAVNTCIKYCDALYDDAKACYTFIISYIVRLTFSIFYFYKIFNNTERYMVNTCIIANNNFNLI